MVGQLFIIMLSGCLIKGPMIWLWMLVTILFLIEFIGSINK